MAQQIRTQAENVLALKVRRVIGFFHVGSIGASIGASIGMAMVRPEYKLVSSLEYARAAVLNAAGFFPPGPPGRTVGTMFNGWLWRQYAWFRAWPPHPWGEIWCGVGKPIALWALAGIVVATAIRIMVLRAAERKPNPPASGQEENHIRGAVVDGDGLADYLARRNANE